MDNSVPREHQKQACIDRLYILPRFMHVLFAEQSVATMFSRVESHLNASTSGRHHHQAAIKAFPAAILVDQHQPGARRCLPLAPPKLDVHRQHSSNGSRRITVAAAGDAAEGGLPGDQGPQAVRLG